MMMTFFFLFIFDIFFLFGYFWSGFAFYFFNSFPKKKLSSVDWFFIHGWFFLFFLSSPSLSEPFYYHHYFFFNVFFFIGLPIQFIMMFVNKIIIISPFNKYIISKTCKIILSNFDYKNKKICIFFKFQIQTMDGANGLGR